MNISILSILFIAMLATSMAFRVNMKTRQDADDVDMCGTQEYLDLCASNDVLFCAADGWCCGTGTDCLHQFITCNDNLVDPSCPWNQ